MKAKEEFRKFTVALDAPGQVELLLGNEAIARGMVEAGVQVIAAYPGTPSSEIVDTLARVAKELGIYVQWSTNEKVAIEVAAAASIAGLRAAATMKSLGLNWALDFVMQLTLAGSGKGGLLLVFCDDPGAISSTNEQDTRWIARMGDLPLLEPSSPHEAKEMAKWAFKISEEIGTLVLMRSVTRVSHASGVVTMGEIQYPTRKASFDISQNIRTDPVPIKHAAAKQKLDKARQIFESSSFNWYRGPGLPRLTIVCCGSCWQYVQDAVEELGVADLVGIIKLGTTSPLPVGFIRKHLQVGSDILVVEEVDPYVEASLKEWLYDAWTEDKHLKIYGKKTGHISAVGEMNPDAVIDGITKILGVNYQRRDAGYDKKAAEYARTLTDQRLLAWCPGCPHRASFWSLKKVLKLDGTGGFVFGDIGCYAMDRGGGGQGMIKTLFCMGAGSGLASGFGKLDKFGCTQPAIAACGDSTFFHAAIPAVINAVHHKADVTFVIFDNSATAMTGFQPHPGEPIDAMGERAIPIDIAELCRTLGCHVEVFDPFDTLDTEKKLWELVGEKKGVKVIVMRHECALIAFRKNGPCYQVMVNKEKCVGEECGCNWYCMHSFLCPAIVKDRVAGKARIDEALCTGCGVCADVCPHGAIMREPTLRKREDNG